MENHGQTSIFISYSHVDRAWMERFRKELKAALFEKADVWCDQDIGEGTEWQDRLALELRGADVALILASSDYLISTWCRRELRLIRQKAQDRQIQNVFWVQVRPCTWERTELAAFQSKDSAQGLALSELSEIAVQREIVDIVRDIAASADDVTKARDTDLTFVRTVAGDQALRSGLTIESVISSDGDFAIVCRGRTGNKADVAIKVLRRSPVRGILEKLTNACQRRKELKEPGFIQLLDAFVTNNDYGEHLVMVTEYCAAQRLSDVLKETRFSIDETVLLIRRVAEALDYLHNWTPAGGPSGPNPDENWYGLMMPSQLFYDERLHRLRLSSLSISNVMWDVVGWRKFDPLMGHNSAPYVAPEQLGTTVAVEAIDKQKLDQYMLGQLAIRLLDGQLPFPGVHADEVVRSKEAFFEDPLQDLGPWKDFHPQLARVIGRMLKRDPRDRWPSMADIAKQLRAVEDESRALARYAFLKWLNNDEFFAEFYEAFFERAGSDARRKFTRGLEDQYTKLRKSMTAVLNFYSGNEPTSLREFVPVHSHWRVTDLELDQFEAAFLDVLKKRLASAEVAGELDPKLADKILDGWKGLMRPVTQYFKSSL